MTDEETRLNRVGAEIVGVEYTEYAKWPTGGAVREYSWIDEEGFKHISKTWNPCHDLNHTDLVKQAMVDDGWDWQVTNDRDGTTGEKIIVVKMDKDGRYPHGSAPLDQEGLAIMRAIEKAMEGG